MTTYASGVVVTKPGAFIVSAGHSFSARGLPGPALLAIRNRYTRSSWAAGVSNNNGWPTIFRTGVSGVLSASTAGAGNFAAKIGTPIGVAPPAGSFVIWDCTINDPPNAVAPATTIANATDCLTRSNAILRADGTPLPVLMVTPMVFNEAAVGTNPFDAQIAAIVTGQIAAVAAPNVLINVRQAWIDWRAGGGGTLTSDGVHPNDPSGYAWYANLLLQGLTF